MTTNEIVRAIREVFDLEELTAIGEELRLQRSVLSNRKKKQFSVVDEVRFTSKYGIPIEGVVEKINLRYIKVGARDGRMWRVSPLLLKNIYQLPKQEMEVIIR